MHKVTRAEAPRTTRTRSNGLRRNPGAFPIIAAKTDPGSRSGGVLSFPSPRPPRIRNPSWRKKSRYAGRSLVEEIAHPGIELLFRLLPASESRSPRIGAHARLHLHQRNSLLPRAGRV